ncbi:MAG TPA: hypothetical protein VLN90_07415, partial [Thioalkalivibrio sp.]|nr:hypothetical protein [Thioalkalivibrio sp.]
MNQQLRARWILALIGGLGGLVLSGLVEVVHRGLMDELAMTPFSALVITFFATLLAMAGPLGPLRAGVRAAGLALVVALLVWLVSLRFEGVGGLFYSPLPVLAALVVAGLPVPFLISQAGPGWRDYPSLFIEAWAIVVRYAAAWAFTGLVWLVIYLSDEVLGIVGITVIGDLLRHEVVPLVITGAVLGLAMAVVYELADLVSPYLVLRLFRLLLPVVLAVMVVFLVAVPVRGLTGLFSGLSPALLLLAMVAAGVSLVSIAVDQSDADATESVFLRRAAQGQALILPVVAGLAGWAIWQRVGQYGWTPDRVFVALVALVAVTYGVIYAVAVVRGAGWMGRIRQGNLWMALGVIGRAALWLTPVLNAERISAADQLARFEAGQTAVEALDFHEIGRWGKPGAAALVTLEAMAKEPGHEALAALLAGEAGGGVPRAERVAELAAILPVQPAGATGIRSVLLDAADDYLLDDWTGFCRKTLEGDRPSCVLVVAELLPLRPGEEGFLFLYR